MADDLPIRGQMKNPAHNYANERGIFSDGVPAGIYEQPPSETPEPFPADAPLEVEHWVLERTVENSVEDVDAPHLTDSKGDK
jgi:hypothetical protein